MCVCVCVCVCKIADTRQTPYTRSLLQHLTLDTAVGPGAGMIPLIHLLGLFYPYTRSLLQHLTLDTAVGPGADMIPLIHGQYNRAKRTLANLLHHPQPWYTR